MKKLNFSVDIHASKEDVWTALWDDASYREWSSAFQEGSHAVTDGWKEGSKVLFLDSNGDGMSSRVERKIPNELMIFKSLGVARDGKEAPLDDEAKKWVGAEESYRLQQNGDVTTLKIEVEAADEYVEIYNEAFPKALKKLKELAEKKHEAASV